jgi:hypothetical protein
VNSIVWLIALVLLGLATGKIVGAALLFTGGRSNYDLVAGLLGALVVGIPLRLAGLTGYSAALPTLIVGVSAAIFATWLRRIITWPAEPVLHPEQESRDTGEMRQPHDLMTTSDGTRILLTAGRLVAPGLREERAQPTGPA